MSAGPELRIVEFGPLPDDLVEGYLTLDSTLVVEAPSGEMVREARAVDVAAWREKERLRQRQGRTSYHTVAMDAAGQVTAYSTLFSSVHEPHLAYQGGTLVRADQRGHRLGLAVKVANQRRLQEAEPWVERVRTWNAGSNQHMVAVNELLGYAPTARLAEMQRQLAATGS